MKNTKIYLLSVLMLLACSSNNSNSDNNEQKTEKETLVGTWKRTHNLNFSGVSPEGVVVNPWLAVDEENEYYIYTFTNDGNYTYDMHRWTTSGTYTLYERNGFSILEFVRSNLKIKNTYKFENGDLFLDPVYFSDDGDIDILLSGCIEGCTSRYKKID